MAPMSIKDDGKVKEESAREMVTLPSSRGWRSTSRTFLSTGMQ
jgi:hypothetical protein